jgi:soluble cytochrome b562
MNRQSPYRRAAALLAACTAVGAVAGCGGGSHPSHHGVSHTGFSARANLICTNLTAKEKADPAATTEAAVRTRLAQIDAAVVQLQQLHPPASEDKRYQDMIAAFKRGDAYFKANLHRLFQLAKNGGSRNPKALAQYNKIASHLGSLLQLAAADATALKLRGCAKGFGGGGSSSSSP